MASQQSVPTAAVAHHPIRSVIYKKHTHTRSPRLTPHNTISPHTQ